MFKFQFFVVQRNQKELFKLRTHTKSGYVYLAVDFWGPLTI